MSMDIDVDGLDVGCGFFIALWLFTWLATYLPWPEWVLELGAALLR